MCVCADTWASSVEAASKVSTPTAIVCENEEHLQTSAYGVQLHLDRGGVLLAAEVY